ncbi:uncharacterized protein SPPG_02640 [Spizellomyces punctatus DAOM BR117]|uniref:CoA-transferase family III n=1 Tax=Spizellomyces punctatus (strain DAOM BR117) TaxID=645134 RepID=A0A0L0HM26_SPIPD|nr:uncharacterized protein SPPG_02640 [Spizellomyces punctatus DAOM BR117]KND02147.1 hypothetical protein SPPG_02640 [Spizellomyces punctatus DAOM BR117]|eukprot:XP_016610186.1 hypothetical protein SPPG_02640 [Spizellomyces punctatus DAOM BR117]
MHEENTRMKASQYFQDIIESIHSQNVLAPVDEDAARKVFFTDQEWMLPSGRPIAALSAAALGALAYSLQAIWNVRRGSMAGIASARVSQRGAAIAVRSHNYCRIVDPPRNLNPWDPLSGLYEAADGRHIQLHCNYSHHRGTALKVLGVVDVPDLGRDKVSDAVRKRDALELETLITEAGGCAAMVRTSGEWDSHPQRRALTQPPLVTIRKLRDTKPLAVGPTRPGARPLQDVKVLDLTHVLAGPTATKALASHGAKVLSVSSPNHEQIEAALVDTNFGKRSAFLDFNDAKDLEKMKDLLKETDIFVQSYRPGALDAFGLSADALAAIRPGIVYVSISAYGTTGPWAGKRGFDTLVQCVSGMADSESDSFAKPKHLPAQILDYASGYLAAFGAVLALRQRALVGGSYSVDVSLARTCEWVRNAGLAEFDISQIKMPTEQDVADLLLTTPGTEYGKVQHVNHAIEMIPEEFSPRFELPTCRRGAHAAEWW